jgi:hypothetical protein
MSIQGLSRDERGIALPMALIVMVILTTLMAAFAVLATSEPQIAGNQAASAQARALAESGVERAIWALGTALRGSPPTGLTIDVNGNVNVSAPYDMSMFLSVDPLGGNLGGYKVKVEPNPGGPPNEMLITAVGFVPNATNPATVKKIKAVVVRLQWLDPKCGLCAGGEAPPGTSSRVDVGGNATVNATEAVHVVPGHDIPAGSFCAGVTPEAAVGVSRNPSDPSIVGTVTVGSNVNLFSNGSDPGNPATATQTGMDVSQSILSDAQMAALKSIAKASGTYYQGSQTFTSPPPNGIVFIDTPSGNPLTSTSPTSDLITVDVHGNWDSGWTGWLIVAGSFRMSGNVTMTGLVYAQNDVTLHGEGNGRINGAVISTNRVDTISSSVDSDDIGNSPLVYDCPAVRSGGGALNTWWVKPGTYQEVSGS